MSLIEQRPTARRRSWSLPPFAAERPAHAGSGPAPRIQALSASADDPPSRMGHPGGYGFPVRVYDEDSAAPIYLYSATISSIDRSDLALEEVEPPFGTAIPAGGCTNVCFHAASTGNGTATFVANLLIRWGHTLPVGSDPDHQGILVQVLVRGTSAG